jgi:hypothetical protein
VCRNKRGAVCAGCYSRCHSRKREREREICEFVTGARREAADTRRRRGKTGGLYFRCLADAGRVGIYTRQVRYVRSSDLKQNTGKERTEVGSSFSYTVYDTARASPGTCGSEQGVARDVRDVG